MNYNDNDPYIYREAKLVEKENLIIVKDKFLNNNYPKKRLKHKKNILESM